MPLGLHNSALRFNKSSTLATMDTLTSSPSRKRPCLTGIMAFCERGRATLCFDLSQFQGSGMTIS